MQSNTPLQRFFDAFSFDRLVEGSAQRSRQNVLEQNSIQAQSSLSSDIPGRAPPNVINYEDDMSGRNVHNDQEIYEAEAQIVGRPLAENRTDIPGGRRPSYIAERRPSLSTTTERRPSISRDGLTSTFLSAASTRRPSISGPGRRPSITSGVGRRNAQGQLIDDPDALPVLPTHIPLVILDGVDDCDQVSNIT